MENDDRQVGYLLSRRDVLKLMGVTGAALLAGCLPGETVTPVDIGALAGTDAPSATGALPACVVRPELTEGPYFVDTNLHRSDIRSDPASGAVEAGALLALNFNVSQVGANGCLPLKGARVEVWHCDAAGLYSDVADPHADTRGQQFLRGYQLTDAQGQAAFTTIYPGWYPGRTVHIHFKIIPVAEDPRLVFTSQLFFDDALSDQVFTQAPYAGRGERNVRNQVDRIFSEQLLLEVAPAGDGYTTTFPIGLQLG
jgi:protocatechuate 3,4-dioxygenase beta subunit